MSMDVRTRVLIAVGASVGANCHPCIENNTAKAIAAGITNEDILAAVEVGKAVRAGAAKSMDQLIVRLTGTDTTEQTGCGQGCCR